MRLEGKVAIVTGGGQGIGRGIARLFSREGAKVAIAARTEARLGRVKDEIEAEGGEVLAVATDVRLEDQVKRLADITVERFGRLDALVNNAGVGAHISVDELAAEDYDRVMDTNLRGMYLGCRYAVPPMKAAGRGSIVNIASVHGVQGRELNSVYAATKGGIIGGTRAMAAELAPFNIRVNAISPGAIWLETMLERALDRIKEEYRDEFLRLFEDRFGDNHRYFQPLQVVGMPEDIAYCAVYLASDESRFVTAQNIVVDGGLTSYMSSYAPEGSREKVKASDGEIRAWIEAHKRETETAD